MFRQPADVSGAAAERLTTPEAERHMCRNRGREWGMSYPSPQSRARPRRCWTLSIHDRKVTQFGDVPSRTS